MNRIFKLIFLAMTAVVFCTAAQAANYTNNASGNWSGSSWEGFPGTPALDAVIVFNPSGPDNSTNDSGSAFLLNQMWVVPNQVVTLSAANGSSLLFTNTGATMPVITNFNAGTFTLNTPITMGTNLTIGVGNVSGSIVVNSNITSVAGTNGLTKAGTGSLTLTGTNTYNGATTVSAGTLTVNGGQITNTAISVAASASLVITKGGQVIGLGASNSVMNGAVNVTGPNSLWTVGGGAYLYHKGVLTVADTGKVVSTTRTYMDTDSGSLVITNGGKFNGAGNQWIGYGFSGNSNSVYVGGNGATWDSGGSSGAILIGYNNNKNSHLTVDNGGVVTNVGALAIGYGLKSFRNWMVITNGGQVFSRSASNIGAYNGGDAANSNSVSIGSSIAASSLWSLGGNSLSIGTSGTTGNWMTVSSGGILTNGSVALDGVSSVLTLGGDAYVSNVNVTASDAQLNFNGGTLRATVNGNLVSGAVWTNRTAASLDSAAYTVTNAIVVAGPGSLTKLGSGTMVLTSNNTYSGVTTVNNGRLKLAVAGSISNSAVIAVGANGIFDVTPVAGFTVVSNQTLAGSGTVTGTVTVANGGILAPGDTNAPQETLTFSSGLTLKPGAVVNFDYSTNGTDKVQVDGTDTFNAGACRVTLNVIGGAEPSGRITLFTFNRTTVPDVSGWTVVIHGLPKFKGSIGSSTTSIYLTLTSGMMIMVQ